MKYVTLNNIAAAGLARLPGNYVKVDALEQADAVLVRSANLLETEFPKQLLSIGRAGAGVNNIPVERCAEEGIVVFNTPGANANGVKELVILGLLLSARDAKGGMAWVDENKDDELIHKSMEKAKAKFAGTEIRGKILGVIGLGAIGVLVANAAVKLGMKVLGYDPYLSVSHALHLDPSVQIVNNTDRIYAESDYVTIHVPENNATRGMLNAAAFEQMKEGTAVLNFARSGLVAEDDLKRALESGKVRIYVTDVPTHAVVNYPHVIAFPHLGASTEESETNCAIMAVDQTVDYLENGNITNSVNYPACTLGIASKPLRVCVAHKNVPNVISNLTKILGNASANISDMVSKSRGDYAYAIFDMDSRVDDSVIEEIRAVPDVFRVRTITK
ncbi:MAG: phosphoglycerate dehydrogenase [Lachnospiraceae bacterium]|nr:phosphoglycerate dehydrogenase [Lachnospiraceae bacterium]